MANYDALAPWVVVLVIACEIGRAFIGFPDWLRQHLGPRNR